MKRTFQWFFYNFDSFFLLVHTSKLHVENMACPKCLSIIIIGTFCIFDFSRLVKFISYHHYSLRMRINDRWLLKEKKTYSST